MENSPSRSFICFLSIVAVIAAGALVEAVPYDYSATLECLEEPLRPQYGGGIILNPELNNGLQGWSKFASGDIVIRESQSGNKFIVAQNRSQPYHGPSVKLYLRKTKLYTLSAWVQVSKGEAPVTAVFKTVSGYAHAGIVHAKSGCWSMLKGGLSVNVSGPAQLYFETTNTDLEIWVDSASLQPFTREEWDTHKSETVEKVRKKRVRIEVVDKNGTAIPDAEVSLTQLDNGGFPLGCAVNGNILNNVAYRDWFTARFKVTSFENEMKWYSTEVSRGKEDYSAADALMAFTKRHRIAVRGHNVLWDDPRYQPRWVPSLSGYQLKAAAQKHVQSVMSRYKGQLIAWDVVNEDLHFNLLESKLGTPRASAMFYRQAHQIDPGTTLFMNDYNTLEEPGDPAVKPHKYIAKMKELAAAAPGAKMAIGLEGHFHVPNLPYMRSALDMLASSRFPIWLTEVDVSSNPHQAQFLKQVLTEAHGHYGVQGIVIWGAWSPWGCYAMCLTDNNFHNLPTGDVVDRLRGLWRSSSSELSGITDSNGFFQANIFHGEYELTVKHQVGNTSVQSWKVSHEMGDDEESRTLRIVV